MSNILMQLLRVEELNEFQKKISADALPVWFHWPEFVNNHLRSGKSEVTVRSVKDAIKLAIRKLGILTIDQLNNSHLVEEALFKYKETNNLKNSSFNSYRKNLNTYCIWLARKEYIAENKMKKVQKCTEKQEEQSTLSEEQVRLVNSHIRERKQTKLERLRNILFIEILRFTGARPSEVLNIRVRDIVRHKDTYKLIIAGKKQKGRTRYYLLPSFISDIYENYLDYRNKFRPDESKLFVSCSKKTGWTYGGIKRLFEKISKEVGFKVTSYPFRRYVATKLNAEGMSLDKIANYLGHTRISTTQRYIERSCALTFECGEVMSK